MMNSKTQKLLSPGQLANVTGLSVPTISDLVELERIRPALVRQYPFYDRTAARRIEIIARQKTCSNIQYPTDSIR